MCKERCDGIMKMPSALGGPSDQKIWVVASALTLHFSELWVRLAISIIYSN